MIAWLWPINWIRERLQLSKKSKVNCRVRVRTLALDLNRELQNHSIWTLFVWYVFDIKDMLFQHSFKNFKARTAGEATFWTTCVVSVYRMDLRFHFSTEVNGRHRHSRKVLLLSAPFSNAVSGLNLSKIKTSHYISPPFYSQYGMPTTATLLSLGQNFLLSNLTQTCVLSWLHVALFVCDLNVHSKTKCGLPPRLLAFVHPNQIVCADATQTPCQTALLASWNRKQTPLINTDVHFQSQSERPP